MQQTRGRIDGTNGQIDYDASVMIGRLNERTSRNSARYFAGRVGATKLVLLKAKEPADGTPVWNVLVSKPRPEPEATSGQVAAAAR